MVPTKRAQRVAKLIQKEAGSFIQKEINTPDVGLVTLTSVEITNDLQHARIYYSVYGSEENRKSAAELLSRLTPLVRYHIGQNVKLRLTPEIAFRYDESVDYAARIESLIEKIHEQEKDGE